MDTLPTVSILINNYNYGCYLSDAIESVLNQTYSNIEIIVVDDGSTDDSHQVINSYKDKIISVFKENGGQASAFNTGFAKSRGDIIIFLDADDYLFDDAVEQVVDKWEPDIVKVQFRLQSVNASRNPIGFYPGLDTQMESGNVLSTLLTKGRYITPVTSGNAFSRKFLSQILPVPESEFRICADAYLVNLVPFYGDIISISHPLGAYRIHGKNFWSTNHQQTDLSQYLISFQRSVLHDLQKYELITSKANELKCQMPHRLGFNDYTHLRPRLASLRLNAKNHPVPSDNPVILALYGVRSLLFYSELGIKKKIVQSFWFLWVGCLPLPLAKLGIERLNPEGGIRPFDWLLKNTVRSQNEGAYQ